MIVIAHFSKWKAPAYVLGSIAGCAIIFFIFLNHPDKISLRDYMAMKGDYAFSIVGFLAGVYVVLLQVTILKQIIFGKRTAIWIESNQVFFLDTYGHVLFSKLSLDEIQTISRGKLGSLRKNGLIADMGDGSKRAIPTWLLAEPLEAVEARLKEAVRG